MELTLDKFGRILIPKDVREELGLRAGSSLYFERTKNGFQLKKLDEAQSIMKKGQTLVFVGKITGDIEGIIDQVRSERDKANWGNDE